MAEDYLRGMLSYRRVSSRMFWDETRILLFLLYAIEHPVYSKPVEGGSIYESSS
jgi:hypothetical protein